MKKLMLVVGAALSCAAFAGPFDRAVLHGETDKARAIDYAPGEEMTFTLTLKGAEPFPEGEYFINWQCCGDDGSAVSNRVPASLTEPLVIKTKLNQPGFVRVLAVLEDKKGQSVKRLSKKDAKSVDGTVAQNVFEMKDKRVFFDGGAGVQIDKLKGVPEPADFDAFWKRQRAELDAVPFEGLVELTPIARKKGKTDLFYVKIPCAGPRPVTGILSVPKAAKNGEKFPAQAQFNGYSGDIARVDRPPADGPADRIFLHVNAHGYDFKQPKEYYTAFAKRIKAFGRTYALSAKEHPEPKGCYFEGMTWRVMRALDYLKSRPEWNGKDLWASGGSQGGLQTAWAAGLEPKLTLANAKVPWCCDMGGNATLGRVQKRWGVDWTPAMGYYDPINMAPRVAKTCTFNITRAGLGDYTCPPSGVAILYNNLKCPKSILWVQGSTHGYVPPEAHAEFKLEER